MPHTKARECDDPLLTTEQAAVIIGVSARTLRRLRVRPGAPPSIQLSPRTWRYRKSALMAWLDAGGVRVTNGDVQP